MQLTKPDADSECIFEGGGIISKKKCWLCSFVRLVFQASACVTKNLGVKGTPLRSASTVIRNIS